MGSIGGKKKAEVIPYQAWTGNEFTNRAKEDMPVYGDWVRSNWESAVTAPNIEDYYQYVKDVNEPAYNDFLQNYNTQANKIAARNYNRFGGLTSTPALYTQDMLNKQMNDLATQNAASMLEQAYGMKNQDWANQLNALGTVYNMYNDAGQRYTDVEKGIYDTWNLNIANENAARNYNAQNASGGFNIGNALSGAMSGATMGSKAGPWGAVIGGVAGGALGGFSGGSGEQSSQLGSSMGGLVNNLNNWSLNTKGKGLFSR